MSIAWGEEHHWATAAAFAPAALEWVAASNGGDAARAATSTSPNVPLAEVLGVRETALAPFDEKWKTERPPGRGASSSTSAASTTRRPGTDLAAVHAGYAAVTHPRRHRTGRRAERGRS